MLRVVFAQLRVRIIQSRTIATICHLLVNGLPAANQLRKTLLKQRANTVHRNFRDLAIKTLNKRKAKANVIR
jgi:hypothetical protein